jgi:hypothetical protein
MTRLPTLVLLLLTACTPLPAHADAFHQQLPADPARPGWRPPAARPYQPAAGVDYDFNPGRGPLVDAHAEDAIWLVGPGAWGAPAGPLQVSPGPVVAAPGCRPAPAAVPGPAGVLAVAGMFTTARQLRRRMKCTH